MPHLPVRPGHLRQRRALMPVLPARLAAAFLPQRPRRGGGLPSPSLDGGLEEFRGVCFSRASSSAIRSRACASSARACASAACDSASSPAQRGHQRGQHLIRRRHRLITGHTRTLLLPALTAHFPLHQRVGLPRLNS